MAKILLVEDDNNLREIFELRLQADGHKTLSAGDGEAALVTAMKEKPDLIICDVMMPRMSGFEMLETLRNAPDMANTKVVMMTALGQAEDQARGAKLGVVKYLVKSQVTLEDFARVVNEVLGPTAGTNAAPAGQPATAANEVSQVNNNKPESEKPMDDPSTNPAPAAPAGDANPISDPAASPVGGDQQTSAAEQSAVDSQINNFASDAAPAASGAPAVDSGAAAAPSSDTTSGMPASSADVSMGTPPAADPAAPAADPAAPADGPVVPPAV